MTFPRIKEKLQCNLFDMSGSLFWQVIVLLGGDIFHKLSLCWALSFMMIPHTFQEYIAKQARPTIPFSRDCWSIHLGRSPVCKRRQLIEYLSFRRTDKSDKLLRECYCMAVPLFSQKLVKKDTFRKFYCRNDCDFDAWWSQISHISSHNYTTLCLTSHHVTFHSEFVAEL